MGRVLELIIRKEGKAIEARFSETSNYLLSANSKAQSVGDTIENRNIRNRIEPDESKADEEIDQDHESKRRKAKSLETI